MGITSSVPGLRSVSAVTARKGRFPIKKLDDGRAMLNLGCGTKMHWAWNNLDFSPYAFLRHHPLLATALFRIGFISDERYKRLQAVDPQVVRWNLRKGIPFSDNTFDVLYHSHFLEHLERAAGAEFLNECHRVLKPTGILRVVVPDLQLLVLAYCDSLEAMERGKLDAATSHQQAIHELLDQMVRTEITGTKKQNNRWVARLEQLIRGNAAAAGELHRWMYDRHSLARLLESSGFRDIQPYTAASSHIAGWKSFQLDTNSDSTPYKENSVYLEASK